MEKKQNTTQTFENAITRLEESKKFLHAFGYMEQMVASLQQQGLDATELVKYVGNAVHHANKNSMTLLEERKPKTALKLLRRAEFMLSAFKCKELAYFMNLTYNNLACVYKRKGKLNLALKWLEKGMEVCIQYNMRDNIAIT